MEKSIAKRVIEGICERARTNYRSHCGAENQVVKSDSCDIHHCSKECRLWYDSTCDAFVCKDSLYVHPCGIIYCARQNEDGICELTGKNLDTKTHKRHRRRTNVKGEIEKTVRNMVQKSYAFVLKRNAKENIKLFKSMGKKKKKTYPNIWAFISAYELKRKRDPILPGNNATTSLCEAIRVYHAQIEAGSIMKRLSVDVYTMACLVFLRDGLVFKGAEVIPKLPDAWFVPSDTDIGAVTGYKCSRLTSATRAIRGLITTHGNLRGNARFRL